MTSSSSQQPYPIYTGTTGITPQQMCSEVTPSLVPTDWYAPSSFSYVDLYPTSYPSSAIDAQAWSSYAKASVPDVSSSSYLFHPPPAPLQTQHHASHFKDPGRPRSSPSTFGPGPDTIPWPATNGLGINYPGETAQPTSTATFPPAAFQSYSVDELHSTSNTPELRQPQPRRPYPNIAPNPAAAPFVKRPRDTDEDPPSPETSSQPKRRKRTTSSVLSADLSEDDRFLVQLKEEENLPWKDIAGRFQSDKAKTFQVAALQMRYKRLREKFRTWEEQDLNALRLAHEYWDKYKWEIISGKMLDFGPTERWPPRHCARKWQELEAQANTHAAATTMTPAMSQFSSPVETSASYRFMPLQ